MLDVPLGEGEEVGVLHFSPDVAERPVSTDEEVSLSRERFVGGQAEI